MGAGRVAKFHSGLLRPLPFFANDRFMTPVATVTVSLEALSNAAKRGLKSIVRENTVVTTVVATTKRSERVWSGWFFFSRLSFFPARRYAVPPAPLSLLHLLRRPLWCMRSFQYRPACRVLELLSICRCFCLAGVVVANNDECCVN
jgi:hypothetical protein